jgi:four helix bundle protein
MADEIRDYKDLVVWRKSILFATLLYKLSARFPKDERFGLTNQVRRAAVSISSNIAEGHERTTREFCRFLLIARGSLAEAESQLYLATELGFVPKSSIAELLRLA